jgi:hypothetical protein
MAQALSISRSTKPAPLAAERRAEFEAKVSERARRFGLKALLDLLAARGYARESILFQGNPEGSATSLVHAVEFPAARGGPRVLITVNLGLLGDNSLLPSYFLREIEYSRDPERFYDFIRFFDHRLIENHVRAVWPEDDTRVYGDYAFMQRALLQFAGFSSVSSLHWFVQLLFPELRVRVSRGAFAAATSSHAFRTGQSRLDGSSVIGRLYESEAQGFLVELVTEEEIDDRGRSWANVLRDRIAQRVMPVLGPFRIPLAIVLRVLSHASWARLEADHGSSEGYLGYDRIRADSESGHSVVLFRGITGEAEGG